MTKGLKFFAFAACAISAIGLASCADDVKDSATPVATDPKTLTLEILNLSATNPIVGQDFVITFSNDADGNWTGQKLADKTGTFKAGNSKYVVSTYQIKAANIEGWDFQTTEVGNTAFQIITPLDAGWGAPLLKGDNAAFGNCLVALTRTSASAVDTAQKIVIDCDSATEATPSIFPYSALSAGVDTSWKTAPTDPKTLTLKIKNLSATNPIVGKDFVITFSNDADGNWTGQKLADKTGTFKAGTNKYVVSTYQIKAANVEGWDFQTTEAGNTAFQIITPLDAGWGAPLLKGDNTAFGNCLVALTRTSASAVDTAQQIVIDCAGATEATPSVFPYSALSAGVDTLWQY